jgi:polar amino acid transport system substrate-binding protein
MGSSTVDFLAGQRIAFEPYAMPADGLRAVKAGRIDAFVYDRPLLAWTVQQDFPDLEVLPITLDSQNYAIALPLDNTIRVALDVTLLETLRSPWWEETRYRYLGRDAAP